MSLGLPELSGRTGLTSPHNPGVTGNTGLTGFTGEIPILLEILTLKYQ